MRLTSFASYMLVLGSLVMHQFVITDINTRAKVCKKKKTKNCIPI